MIETYKVMYGLQDVNSSQFFARSNMDGLHEYSLKLYKEHYGKIIRKEFFSQKVIDQWLPEKL